MSRFGPRRTAEVNPEQLAGSLTLLRELSALRLVQPRTEEVAMRIRKLELALSSVDRRGDPRQLVLIAALFLQACGDASFTAFGDTWQTDGATPIVDAGTADSHTTFPDRWRSSTADRVSPPSSPSIATDTGIIGAGGSSSVDAGTTPPWSPPPSRRDAWPRPTSDARVEAAPTSTSPPPLPPVCTKYVGAVFVCSGVTPVPYYPCPVRPPECVQAGSTAVVCCPK